MLQDTSKTPQDVPRHLQDAPRRALDTSKSRFWWILEPKMDPSWHQNHIQKRHYVKTAWKQKMIIFPIEFKDFHNSGIDFWSIFDWFGIDFWSFFHRFIFIASPSFCCLITCVLGAVAGTQLCCALDTYQKNNTMLLSGYFHFRYICLCFQTYLNLFGYNI